MASPNEKISAPQTSAPQRNDDKINQTRQNNVPSVTNHLVHSLPSLPSCQLTGPHDDITLPRLIEALKDRHRMRQMMTNEYNKSADMMKSRLQEMDSNLMVKDSVIREKNSKLVEKDKIIHNSMAEIERLEKRSGIQERDIDILQNTTKIYEDDKRSMQQELETIEQSLQREQCDKKRIEQHMHNVVKNTQHKWEKECDRLVNKMQAEMKNKLWVKEEKLRQLKAIVTEGIQSHPDPLPLHTQPRRPRREEHVPVRQESDSLTEDEEVESNPRPACPVSSNSKYFSVARCISEWEQTATPDRSQDYRSPCSPMRSQSPACSSVSRTRRRAMHLKRQQDEASCPTFDLEVMKQSHRTESPVRPLHHRSRSADGDKWVHHKPPSTLDVGTVFQLAIPNAVQVSSPSKKNLLKSDGYLLTHQEVASDGEIRTKLIKVKTPRQLIKRSREIISELVAMRLLEGDVIKTRGGGRAIQFIDIETLEQKHIPLPSKRKSPRGKPANGQ